MIKVSDDDNEYLEWVNWEMLHRYRNKIKIPSIILYLKAAEQASRSSLLSGPKDALRFFLSYQSEKKRKMWINCWKK